MKIELGDLDITLVTSVKLRDKALQILVVTDPTV